MLGEEGDGAEEEVVPGVVLEVDGEVVPDGVGQLTQGVQHHRIHQHGHLRPVRRIDAVHGGERWFSRFKMRQRT